MGRFLVLFVTGLAFFSGCTSLQRSRTSGYAEEYETTDAERDPPSPTRGMASVERESFETRYRLKQLENNLSSLAERSQYYRVKPLLSGDKERIEFLSLRDVRARERFLQNKGLAEVQSALDKSIRSAIEEGDIMLGMPKEAVEAAWGSPDQKEIAGNSQWENERWLYSSYIPAPEGYQKETRIIYFENGRVIGWVTE